MKIIFSASFPAANPDTDENFKCDLFEYKVFRILEHMLFQGTDKYPGENEYSEYM